MEKSPSEIADALPKDVADAFVDGAMTLTQALIAESMGIIDVWNLPGKRWCPCMTTLGWEVSDILTKRKEHE